MNLVDFVNNTKYGACVGAQAAPFAVCSPPAGIEYRAVSAALAPTLDALFDGLAMAWHFPQSFFRRHGKDAFDDWMRDLDNLTNPDMSKPPAAGYLTEVCDAHLLLIEQPQEFTWFAKSVTFYRDYYRDEAKPSVGFGLLLTAPADHLNTVRSRWSDAGIEVATVTL